MLNSLYIVLLIFVLKNIYEVRQLLKEQRRVIFENNVEPLMTAITLKVQICNQFSVIILAYFAFELIINGLIPLI